MDFDLPPSKSIEARRMILKNIRRMPISDLDSVANVPDDLKALQQALLDMRAGKHQINVAESGTAMRFMLAYLSCEAKADTVLMGEGRQHHRPIAPLVNALRELGAKIEYLERESYPPLLIKYSELSAKKIHLDASESSQYLSALLLIAPLLKGGGYQIETTLSQVASKPYVMMTIEEMREAGFIWQQKDGLFSYLDTSVARVSCPLQLESDWSAASYAYLLMCLLGEDLSAYTIDLHLRFLLRGSRQGDEAFLTEVYEKLGLRTTFQTRSCFLSRIKPLDDERLLLNCRENPDVVPALVATCVALMRPFTLSGVKNLRLKESNRLEAIENELLKLGVYLSVEEDAISWDAKESLQYRNEVLHLETYKDHRIAMAFAPLMARFSDEGVVVKDADCVAKSFPNYWREIEKLGYITTIL